MISNWRNIYALTIPLRIILALQPSYLHPDEHLQSFEVLARQFLGYKTNVPWEFSSNPSRSILPLLIEYPAVYLNKWLDFPPMTIYYLTRIQFCIMSWMITDWCLYKIMPTKQERLKAIFFNSLSYITLCYQSHTFSNSVETCLLLLALVIIEDLRDTLEVKAQLTVTTRAEFAKKHLKQAVYLGLLLGFGILNRVTFPLWLVVPSYFVFKYGLTISFSFLTISACTTLMTIFTGIAVDIWWFNKPFVNKWVVPYLHTFLVTKDVTFLKAIADKLYEASIASPSIIPIVNNLIYNLDNDNLKLHGLHGRYTHLLINLPVMFGPLILLIAYPMNYMKTTPFLSFISGVVLLSLFPHQELRFLLPAVPLGCCFVDLWLWTTVKKIDRPMDDKQNTTKSDEVEEQHNKKDESELKAEEETVPKKEKEEFMRTDSKLIPVIIRITILFNLAMCFIMGVAHQGGVIPTLEFLKQRNESTKSISIWWRSYTPPLWLLGDNSLSIFQEQDPEIRLHEFYNYITDDLPQTVNSAIDVAGMDPDILKYSLHGMLQNSEIPVATDVLIMAPVAAFNNLLSTDTRFNFTSIYDYKFHLDFDHFDDFNDFGINALEPGFGVWKIQSIAPILEPGTNETR